MPPDIVQVTVNLDHHWGPKGGLSRENEFEHVWAFRVPSGA
jgi:hypothetical protein